MATFTLTSETGRYALNPAALTLEDSSGSLLLEDGFRLVLEVGSTREAQFIVTGPVTLTADTGAFALTGNAATFTVAVALSAQTGTYALSGNAASLNTALLGTAGAYAFTGNAATFLVGAFVTALTGSYVFTGNAAALTTTEVAVQPSPGGAGFVHRFTRKRWRELMDLIAAEKAAREKAGLADDPKREAALQAEAEAAQAAIFAAQVEGRNDELDRLLTRNANAIRASIRASAQVKLLKEAARAITISQEIANRRKAEDEEEEMIMLLLAS